MSRPAGRPARRLGLVVNPTAGGGRAVRTGRLVHDALRAAGHRVHDLSAPDARRAGDDAGQAVATGAVDALVVVGGDGMVHLGAQAVAGTGVPLGIVAAGSGNDFARTLGVPARDPGAACARLCAALGTDVPTVRAVDALHVRGAGLDRWVAGAVSAGLDAAVNARANATPRPRGPARYALAALREIAGYRPWSYRLTFDGVHDPDHATRPERPERSERSGDDARRWLGPDGRWAGRAALVTVANAPRIGGGVRVAPGARVDDGLLDVVVATDLSRPAAAAAFPSMFVGAHLHHPRVHVVRARGVLVEPGPATPTGRPGRERPTPSDRERPLPDAYGDGEHLGALPLRVTARAGALHVLDAPARRR